MRDLFPGSEQVYPKLVRRTGLIWSYRSGTWMTLLLVVIFPFVHLLAPEDGSGRSAVALWCDLWATLARFPKLRMLGKLNRPESSK